MESSATFYLKNVLGVRSVMVPPDFVTEPQAHQAETSINTVNDLIEPVGLSADPSSVAEFQKSAVALLKLSMIWKSTGDLAHQELFNKICDAVKPPNEDLLSIHLEALRFNSSEISQNVLCFGFESAKDSFEIENELGVWQEHNGTRVMITHSPQAAIQNPAFKKEIWRDMKRAMAASNWEVPK
jgi:hypothetical protein